MRERFPLLVRMAMRVFPQAFREEFGADMERAYAESIEAGGPGRIRRMWRAVLDLVTSGLRERLDPTWHPDFANESKRFRGGERVDHLVQDFRFAVRSLARRPAFTIVAMLTLALGIGANTSVFSVIEAVLLRALPYVDPETLVRVWVSDPADATRRGVMSNPDTEDIAALPAFESLVGVSGGTVTLAEGEEPEVIPVGRVTKGLLSTFRLAPLMGRDIDADDNAEGSPLVAVLSYRFWQTRLSGRNDVVGTTLQLSGRSFEIVGVAPDGFAYPENAEMWVARRLPPNGCGRGCHTLATIGRLSAGATVEAASAQVASLAVRLSDEYPQSNFEKQFRVVRLLDDQVADVRNSLWFILGAVGLVLMIACANVANLLMVRGETRRGEIAVRTALGASRGRLAGQVLMESVVLTLGGAIAGIGLAWLAVGFVRGMPPGVVPRTEGVRLNGSVLLFTLAMSVIVALLFGLGPSLRQSRAPVVGHLVSDRRGGDTRAAKRLRSLLLTIEVALSLLLLVGAGLVLKSFDRMYRVDLGFTPDHLTRFGLSLPSAQYDSIDRITTFYSQLEERLAALPGVEAVGSVFAPPFGSTNMTGDVEVEGRPKPEPGQEEEGSMHSATPGYAATIGLPIIRGRWIEATDRASTVSVAVLSQQMADRVFHGEDPLGKRFRVSADFGYGDPVWTVVGVVGNVKRGVTSSLKPDLYVPLPQYGPGQLSVTMRTRAGMAPGVQQLRSIVHDLDPALPLRDLEPVTEAIAREVAPTRFYMLTLASFAALAVVLAAVGLYGVVAYLVSRRTREIGIRMALGARREQVVGLVLRQGVRPAVLGLIVGLALSLAFGRVAESLLFQVSPRDPLIITAVTLLLAAVSTIAVFLPARRASRVDPVTALRAE
jgi:putative ABC transport system permease protein